MALGSSFMGLSDSIIDTVAIDWFVGEPRYQDIFVLSQSFQPPSSSPSEPLSTFSPEIPLDQSSTPGATQNIIHLVQTPRKVSIPQPRTTATLPNTALPTASHDEMTEAELCFTDFPQQLCSVPPAFSLPAQSLPPATALPLNWIKVPQSVYGHGSTQWDFKRSESIYFSTNGRPGINLGDALRKKYAGLDGQGDPMLQDSAGAISCRLLFPGYPDNGSSCQIHTLNWTRSRLPIPRSKLAHEVAKKLDRYLNRMARITPDPSVEDCWRIGRGFMHINNMFLVSLVSVSKGSFQPEIWIADPSVQTETESEQSIVQYLFPSHVIHTDQE
ncbi:hypothetical protein BDM02DRAFT_3123468 [Thelephora ganbajun]|uniref:Uncharacterized protein n=1 Tax=Thelephora ganbajun TaxID=370292 RepID=A0ACB6Z1F8_THEGA|nr:hypothetical protein BDM02DRAFT_3123468 [Thelephora ganbajun]